MIGNRADSKNRDISATRGTCTHEDGTISSFGRGLADRPLIEKRRFSGGENMSIVPLTLGTTVATTREEYDKLGGDDGEAILIMEVDFAQIPGKNATEKETAGVKSSNVTYDLRVGHEYRDHREKATHHVDTGKKIVLHPGAALIIQTLEWIRLPRGRFGIVSPKLGLLQRGVSNTFSKVDPGYDGPLLITVFNLGGGRYRIGA
jgi:dCTP deaminase